MIIPFNPPQALLSNCSVYTETPARTVGSRPNRHYRGDFVCMVGETQAPDLLLANNLGVPLDKYTINLLFQSNAYPTSRPRLDDVLKNNNNYYKVVRITNRAFGRTLLLCSHIEDPSVLNIIDAPVVNKGAWGPGFGPGFGNG